MSVELNVIYNANLYLNGNTQIGRATEVKLPEIEIAQDEYKGLGLHININLPMGIKVGEGEIMWNGFYPEAFRAVYAPFGAQQIMVRADVQQHNAQGRVEEVPLVAVLVGTFIKSPLGTYKPQERAEFASSFNSTSGTVKIGGREVLHYDAFANKYRVDGVDMLAKFRRNIGQ